MSCQHYQHSEAGARTFTVAMPKLTFGRGALGEVGVRVANRGFRNAALFTDDHLRKTPYFETLCEGLKSAGVAWDTFSDIRIEPDDATVQNAARFISETGPDVVISLGGGSVIDTAKAASVYARYPAPVNEYFAPPVGPGTPVPGPLLPHFACPTTSGTGSECTSVSVIRINALDTKFVLGSPHLLPMEAIVDPTTCETLPPMAVASCGFDLLCHALECLTARAYTTWEHVDDPTRRPLLQGSNPWSDLAARKALEIAGNYLVRGVNDAADAEARDNLMWGATLAGMAFGNSGTHLPHAMSYGITNLMADVTTRDYTPTSPFVPHGISVAVTAPAALRYLAESAPARHLEAATLLGATHTDAAPAETGEVIASRVIELMKTTDVPNGLADIGFDAGDAKALAVSAARQTRAIANAPRIADVSAMENIYTDALSYW